VRLQRFRQNSRGDRERKNRQNKEVEQKQKQSQSQSQRVKHERMLARLEVELRISVLCWEKWVDSQKVRT
jgi:hypothetical protein